MNARRLAPYVAVAVALLTAVGLFVLDPRGDNEHPAENGPSSTLTGSQGAVVAPEGDEPFDEETLPAESREAVEAAELVALSYASFPSEVGDLSGDADLHLERLAPYVTDGLLAEIRTEWGEVLRMSMSIEAEVLPGSYVTEDGATQKTIVVGVRRRLVNPSRDTAPWDSTYRLVVTNRNDKWVVASIEQ